MDALDASVVTLGTFDGVHRGHQRLAAQAIARAKQLGVPSVAYTFHPHPAKVLAPQAAPRLLLSTDERVRLLCDLGIDIVVVEPFDTRFASIVADDWVQRYLVEALRPKHVVVGFNFSYGRGRGGSPEHLRRAGEAYGFSVEVIEAVQHEGEVVSSTRIRAFLEVGDVERAARLLGRPFALNGTVIEGDKRGRTIGFPTANLAPAEEMIPASGVYAPRVALGDGRWFDSVTNVGTRPTFDGKRRLIETHVFDFAGDLYGQTLRVEMVARLRDEQKFDGIDALIAQIEADAVRARERLAR